MLQMKQVLEGLLWEEFLIFLDHHDVLRLRTSANKCNVASKYGPCGEVFFFLMEKEPNKKKSGISSARNLDFTNSCGSWNKNLFSTISKIMGMFLTVIQLGHLF